MVLFLAELYIKKFVDERTQEGLNEARRIRSRANQFDVKVKAVLTGKIFNK